MSFENSNTEKINFEFDQIEAELSVVDTLNIIKEEGTLDEIQIRAAASSLHSIYNGIEKLLIFKFKDLDLKIPQGSKWHSTLLITARRKKVISDELEIDLREMMGFRHFYRHSYGFMLEIDLIDPLLEKIRRVLNRLKTEILE